MAERDPNYVTSEEAKEKICTNSQYCCVGADCMAWRWHEYKSPVPIKGRAFGSNWEKEISKTYGRCGMVPL